MSISIPTIRLLLEAGAEQVTIPARQMKAILRKLDKPRPDGKHMRKVQLAMYRTEQAMLGTADKLRRMSQHLTQLRESRNPKKDQP